METMFLQNFGGQTKSIMVFLKVAYSHSTMLAKYETIGLVSTPLN